MTETWQPPAGANPTVDPLPRGRIRRGIWLTRKAWTLMASGHGLWTLPIVAAVALAFAGVLIFVPLGILAGGHGRSPALAGGAALAAFILTTISVFFQVGFLAQVDAHIEGRSLSAREGLAFARGRLGAIVGWAALTTGVGFALRALQNLSGGEVIGRVVGILGGLAWSLASFFVVPVLALEDAGPVEALKRSVAAFRRRWGEQVTGDLVIGSVYALAFLAFVVVMIAGLVVAVSVPAIGVIVIVAGVSGMLATIVVASTISRVFGLVVYRYATGRPLPAPFTEADVAASFKPKKKR